MEPLGLIPGVFVFRSASMPVSIPISGLLVYYGYEDPHAHPLPALSLGLRRSN
jgi:hypothetical protein